MLSLFALAVTVSIPSLPTGNWQLSAEDTHCTLIHDFAGESGAVSVGIRPMEGSGTARLIVASPEKNGVISSGWGSISFGVKRESLRTRYNVVPVKPEAMQVVHFEIPETALDGLLTPGPVTIKASTRSWTVQMPIAKKARAALATCQDDLLKSWAAKVPAPSALYGPALDRNQVVKLFGGPDNYPVAARDAGADGPVVSMLVISAAGTVDQCETLTQTHPALAAKTCELAALLTFKPPVDATGRALASRYDLRFRWVLPGG